MTQSKGDCGRGQVGLWEGLIKEKGTCMVFKVCGGLGRGGGGGGTQVW